MGIKDEVSSLDRDLCIFPMRAFEFKNAGTIIIPQDVADVGSVVWDAEVVLAHYLDLVYGSKLRGRRVLELGAGTGLAGIVAAKLGATVLLTDQTKILPTLIASARTNVPELEAAPSWPHRRSSSWWESTNVRGLAKSHANGTVETNISQLEDDVVDAPDSESASAEPATAAAAIAAVAPVAGGVPEVVNDAPGKSNAWSLMEGESTGMSHSPFTMQTTDPGRESLPEKMQENARGCPCGDAGHEPCPGVGRQYGRNEADQWPPGEGSWRVAELLFSEDEATLREAIGLGDECSENLSRFDLVMAADVAYLVNLWDALVFTIKVLVKPGGEALMSFEQRRGNVDSFFGPPRFGSVDGTCTTTTAESIDWAPGEEIKIGEGSSTAALGEAAAAANVRLFRMPRRRR